jgi:orotate phosphoribosyltransferase
MLARESGPGSMSADGPMSGECRLGAEPVLRHQLARALLALLPDRVDALAGLELGGTALATMCSHIAQRPARFLRRPSEEHGGDIVVQGGAVGALRLAVIDEVIGDGVAAAQSCVALKDAGAHVCCVACVVDRQEGAAERLGAIGVPFNALFRAPEIEGDGWRAMLGGVR